MLYTIIGAGIGGTSSLVVLWLLSICFPKSVFSLTSRGRYDFVSGLVAFGMILGGCVAGGYLGFLNGMGKLMSGTHVFNRIWAAIFA
jgi:hypothetical protein